MALYLSVPILDAMIKSVELEPIDSSAVKALSFGLLIYYFRPANGYLVAPVKFQINQSTDNMALRVQRLAPQSRIIIDHTVAGAKCEGGYLLETLEQFENTFGHAKTEFGRCWAVLFHGSILHFYEYHRDIPGARLVPRAPLNQ
ncbi:uncharacterized protein KD926_002159 [Aspergillus affinis]|uniref:uncharacterized protein n=1 Tax=Aspergillus affinis TaxID=1070780 RepID=UPI0022FEC617|nr:uncharacterized protein KD926_002159 [Aspergillus affinis]KAI9036250.1 hypothetical protein KD926_002159 [Aspergillus affinis]